ncbi:DUF1365-domain-containing protein [Neoconidiobolus thromboides FSU 785]|nr:DUF1365-domain-containing protein [Neoconidiobolus thromboides FSU 785]
MEQTILLGETIHQRYLPVQHDFKYSVFYFAIDLNNIQQNNMFKYNQFSLFSIYDKDYFTNNNYSIKENFLNYLKDKLGYSPEYYRIVFVTTPRVLGYSFNPVSFYFCYDTDLKLQKVVYEVNNTFGERHIYILEGNDNNKAIINRDFHVSPFNDRKGIYETEYKDIIKSNKLYVKLRLIDSNKDKKFMAKVSSNESLEFTCKNLSYCLVYFSYHALLTMPRILYEAFKLHYFKKITIFQRPTPRVNSLLYKDPDFIESYCYKLIEAYFLKLSKAFNLKIHLNLPASPKYPNSSTILNNITTVKDSLIFDFYGYELFTGLILETKINQDTLPILASTYMRGCWKCNKLGVFLVYWNQFIQLEALTSKNQFNLDFIQSYSLSFISNTRKWMLKKQILLNSSNSQEVRNLDNSQLVLPIHSDKKINSAINLFDTNANSIVFHALYILLGLFLMTLENKIFQLIASFERLKSPNEIWKRYYYNLSSLLELNQDNKLKFDSMDESNLSEIKDEEEKFNLFCFIFYLNKKEISI